MMEWWDIGRNIENHHHIVVISRALDWIVTIVKKEGSTKLLKLKLRRKEMKQSSPPACRLLAAVQI